MIEQSGLTGKVAVVTGGGRGIGAAIAKQLAQAGADVIIAGRTLAPLEKTVAEIRASRGNCDAVQCDVADLGAVDRLADTVRRKHSGCDIVVNNAGIGSFSVPLHQLPPEEWDRVMNTNLRGPYYCMRVFTPMMVERGGGDFVNISSIAGKNPLPNGAVYSASKWGLNGLSYSAAEELRKYKIRVTVICPGSTATELSPHEGKDAGKMLQPDDIARVVLMVVTQAPQSFASEIILRPTQKP